MSRGFDPEDAKANNDADDEQLERIRSSYADAGDYVRAIERAGLITWRGRERLNDESAG